jgi:hypothetical protein
LFNSCLFTVLEISAAGTQASSDADVLHSMDDLAFQLIAKDDCPGVRQFSSLVASGSMETVASSGSYDLRNRSLQWIQAVLNTRDM